MGGILVIVLGLFLCIALVLFFFVVALALAVKGADVVAHTDFVACATHGRSPLGRLVHGGVAWHALAHSTVPVLLRRIDEKPHYASIFAEPRKIMVPLDGSELAETALPLAAELAEEWDAR